MALKAGSLSDRTPSSPPGDSSTIPSLANSMAAAMEEAFGNEWKNAMTGSAPAPNNQARLMFTAIAQGIVKHLNENPGAFTVTVTNGVDTFTGAVTDIAKTP